jgi:hypothetical protein
LDDYWQRSDDAVARAVGGDIFLAAPGEGSIHALNPMASAVWRALETPRTLRELCALFAAAFPDADPREITGDLSELLDTLEKDDLVSHVGFAARRPDSE